MDNKALVPGGWVLLSYRMPREPSSPRVAVWRRLQKLGVAQLGDGLVALPADARSREHFDWIASDIIQNHGTATVWLGSPVSRSPEQLITGVMTAERSAEYRALISEAGSARSLDGPGRARAARKLRGQLRTIGRRDYFPPPERDLAAAAVAALVDPETTGPAVADAPDTVDPAVAGIPVIERRRR